MCMTQVAFPQSNITLNLFFEFPQSNHKDPTCVPERMATSLTQTKKYATSSTTVSKVILLKSSAPLVYILMSTQALVSGRSLQAE